MSLGTMLFEDMEPIKSDIQEIKVSTEKEPIILPQEEIRLPLSDEKLLALQGKDKFCSDISTKLQQGQLQEKNPYYKENEILKRYVEDGKQRFTTCLRCGMSSTQAKMLVLPPTAPSSLKIKKYI